MSARDKMDALIIELRTKGFRGLSIGAALDVPMNEWSDDYASVVLSICEPEGELASYFDYGQYVEDLMAHIATHFRATPEGGPRTMRLVKSSRVKVKPGERVLRMRDDGCWQVAVECYRVEVKKKRKAPASRHA